MGNKGDDGFGGNKAEDGGWVGWECYVMEWGVKSLFWGILSNGVCRDSNGVYIEHFLVFWSKILQSQVQPEIRASQAKYLIKQKKIYKHTEPKSGQAKFSSIFSYH